MLADVLGAPPSGLPDLLALVAGLDDALVHGLARVDEERAGALERFASAFAGSPLADRVADSVGKLLAGTVTDDHLLSLAGARVAALGTAHDALVGGLDSALGRLRRDFSVPTGTADDDAVPAGDPVPSGDRVLAGSRSWLRELALTGWRGVDHQVAAAGTQNVPPLLALPAHRRLAVLLDGFAGELRATAPVATFPRVPVRRWADLWCRAVLLSQGGVPSQAPAPVDGRFLALGVDLHEHPTVVRAQVHGLLETREGTRLVRTSVAAAKVDTITGMSVWRMLAGFPVLLGALAGSRTVDLAGMPLTPSGDLVWNETSATPGEPADPFAVARVQLGSAVASFAAPLDRHPATIAEPVLLEGYTATATGLELGLELGGHLLAVDLERLPAAGPVTPALVTASTACIGLLRWDAGRWSVQPLAVQATVRRKPVTASTADWALGPTEARAAKAEAVAGTAVEVLRERAGRLLRR